MTLLSHLTKQRIIVIIKKTSSNDKLNFKIGKYHAQYQEK